MSRSPAAEPRLTAGAIKAAPAAVDLEGRGGNRGALHARVTVRAGDLVQTAERRSGGSYLSHNDGRLHFGFGTRTSIDVLEVRWPDGTVQKLTDVPVDAFVKAREGVAELERLSYPRARP